MKKYLFVLLLLTLFSCNRQTDFEKMLIDGDWTFHMEENRWSTFFIRFYEDGSYKCFDASGTDFNGADTRKISQKWEYKSEDNKFIFLGREFKITSSEQNIIHLTGNNTSFTLVKSMNTIPEPEAIEEKSWRCLGG